MNLRDGLTSDPLFNNRSLSVPFSRSGNVPKIETAAPNVQLSLVLIILFPPTSF